MKKTVVEQLIELVNNRSLNSIKTIFRKEDIDFLLKKQEDDIKEAYAQGRFDEETRFPFATDEDDYFNKKFKQSLDKPVNPNNQEVMFHEERQEYFHEDFIDGKKVTVWLGKNYTPKEESKQSTKDRIMSETSKGTKQKAKDYGNSLVTQTETLQDIAENYATDKQNEKASKFYIALESFIAGYELANVVGHTIVQYHNQLINQKWIEILNKADLPTNESSYFVFSNSKFPRVDIFTGRLSNAWDDQHNKCHFTHYIKINKPNQPII